MAVAFDAFSNVAAGTGDLSWTHTPVGTPRGVKVDIVENGGTNGVSGVTYGGVAMELAAVNAKTSGEAGTVVTYFLGRSIPTGAQTVSVTVNDAVSKRASATTVTAATDTCWISADISVGSDSITNPSSTLNLLGKTCFVSLAGHSGQGAVTGTTPSTGWTSRLEHDFGAQVSCWYTYNTVSTSNVACGWTQTADDAVMVALAITEAPVAIDSSSVGITESASVTVVYDSRALPILLIESASVTILTSLSAVDSLTVQGSEGQGTISLAVSASDTSAVRVSESASVATLAAQQALPIYLTDSASVTQIGIFTSDSVGVGCTDVGTLESSVPFFTVQDSHAVGLSDARPTIATETGAIVISATDSCAVQGTDATSNLQVFTGSSQSFLVSDSLKVQLNGSGVAPVSKTATDSASITIEEPTIQDGSFSILDSTAIGVSESASVNTGSLTAFFATSDQAAVQASESASLVNNTILSASDSMKIQTPEDVPDVAVVIVATDSASVVATEPSDQYTQLGVIDSLAVQASAEVLRISGLLTFAVTDSLAVGLSEVTSFGTVVVGSTDSSRVAASELLTNSASVSSAESLRATLAEVTAAFKDMSAGDSLSVQLTDTASPIFNSFIDISASDSCAVQASESISELISFLSQLTVSDSLLVGEADGIAEAFVNLVASDNVPVSTDGLASIFDDVSTSDTLKVGTIEQGLAIPRVTVNIETFTDDTILGELDGDASVEVVYEAIEKNAVDGIGIQCSEDDVLQYGLSSYDLCLVGVSDSVATEVVPNASPNTWNGNTATEHRNDKPKPWKYIFSDKLNW